MAKGGKVMRICLLYLMTFLVCSARPAQSILAFATDADQKSVADFAQTAAVRALDYKQGDRASLMDAEKDFTAKGWSEFMKRLQGWLDDKGAPLGSSLFTPTADAVMKGEGNGVVHVTIPGTLKQSQNKSSTTYRVVVEVALAGKPMKIELLEVRTCGGGSTATSCE